MPGKKKRASKPKWKRTGNIVIKTKRLNCCGEFSCNAELLLFLTADVVWKPLRHSQWVYCVFTGDVTSCVRYTWCRAFLASLNELNDYAGQHELIAENMTSQIITELTRYSQDLKAERKSVSDVTQTRKTFSCNLWSQPQFSSFCRLIHMLKSRGKMKRLFLRAFTQTTDMQSFAEDSKAHDMIHRCQFIVMRCMKLPHYLTTAGL